MMPLFFAAARRGAQVILTLGLSLPDRHFTNNPVNLVNPVKKQNRFAMVGVMPPQ